MTETTWTSTTIALSKLKPWERNPKRISKAHAARLLDLWERLGQFQTIAIGPGGEVYDGHQRLSVLKAKHGGGYVVQVLQASRELTEAEREELTIAAHSGTTGSWDWDALAGWDVDNLTAWGLDEELLKDWNAGATALREMLAAETAATGEDPGAQIDRAAELQAKWGTATGQMWLLDSGNGYEHRLICGDCTDASVVARVMGGERAEMVFIDPPYNVAVKGKFTGAIANDNLETHKFIELLKGAFTNVRVICSGSWYVCFEVLHFDQVLEAIGERPDEVICWAKDSASFYSPNVYNRQFETIMFFKRDGNLLAAKETNLWMFPKSSSFNHRDEQGLRFNQVGSWLTIHPTTKPLLLVERAIQNSSQPNEPVFDGFLGSGTTLIACERLGRRCRACEIEPGYVAVALERWATMTNQTPTLLDGAS